MNVMNRKMFANRDARRKLANMGGIMTSSPELINTVQSFRKGGRTITFGNTKLVLFDDGEMYAELEDGRRVKLGEQQKNEIKALLEIRNERLMDEVTERGATAEGPGVFSDTIGDTGSETISPEVRQEVKKQSRVLNVLAAGKGLAGTAKEFGLGALEVADIAAGVLGLGFNELSSLTGEAIATLLKAAGVPEDFNIAGVDLSPSAFATEAGDIRQSGRRDFLDEGNIVPRFTGIPLSYIEDRIKAEEDLKNVSPEGSGIGPVKNALTTPEQRAEIAAQSDAAIKRASPETLRDTGKSVGFTGTTDLLSATPKSGVMSSLGGSEVLFDLLQGGDTVPDKTASVGFEGGDSIAPPVSFSSGPGEGIMSQAPGISVPNVDIGEAGLERAREIAERDAAIRNTLQDPSITGITDYLDKVQNEENINTDFRKSLRDGVLNVDMSPSSMQEYFPLGDDPRSKAISDLNNRALRFLKTDTYQPLSEIYGDMTDPLTAAKFQEATPEELAILRQQADAKKAAEEQGFYTEENEDFDPTLNASQKIAKNFKERVDILKEKRADEKKVEEDQGFYTEEDEEIPVEGPELQELLEVPFNQRPSVKELDPEPDGPEPDGPGSDASDKIQENLKKNPKDPAGAVTKSTLDDEGIDTSNMSLKERVKSMRGVLSELVGDSDEDKNEEFWLAMARIGFGVAAGEDSSALKNIADGVLGGINEMAKDRKADKKRDDDFTLAAFDMVRQEDRDTLNYQRQVGLIDARQRSTQDEDISTAFRLQKNAYIKSLTDMVPKYGTGSDTSIEELNRQATNLAFQDLATQFSPQVLKNSILYKSPTNKTFIDNAIEALNAQQYL